MEKDLKIRTIFLSLVMAVAFSATASAKPSRQIVRGMTKDQVTAAYGKPFATSFNDTSETWQYVKSRGGLLDSREVLIKVSFDADGKVVGYDETIKDTPSSAYEPSSSSSFGDVIRDFSGRPSRSLSQNAFEILYNKVRQASFESGKLDLIEVASLGGYFTCAQCARLLSIFSFTDGKMKALRFVAPHITDKQNASDIYRQFSFSSDKDKAAEIVSGAQK